MRKIIGILLMGGCVWLFIYNLYHWIMTSQNYSLENTLSQIGIFIVTIIVGFYISITLFEKPSLSPDDHKRISYENEVIKLKIEQRKLQNELKELQANK